LLYSFCLAWAKRKLQHILKRFYDPVTKIKSRDVSGMMMMMIIIILIIIINARKYC